MIPACSAGHSSALFLADFDRPDTSWLLTTREPVFLTAPWIGGEASDTAAKEERGFRSDEFFHVLGGVTPVGFGHAYVLEHPFRAQEAWCDRSCRDAQRGVPVVSVFAIHARDERRNARPRASRRKGHAEFGLKAAGEIALTHVPRTPHTADRSKLGSSNNKHDACPITDKGRRSSWSARAAAHATESAARKRVDACSAVSPSFPQVRLLGPRLSDPAGARADTAAPELSALITSG